MLELSTRLATEAQTREDLPSEWIEKYFYVPSPRDPVTAEVLPAGPIILANHQRKIIDEALSKTSNGLYKYTTIIYSAPKKSGKSAISAAVAKFMGFQIPYGSVYCLANDGKQSNDRLYGPIYTSFQLHNRMNGEYKGKVRLNLTDAILPNFTKIEAIPCDAAGEAGSEPTATFWSELWGFDSENKRRLWTEMTVPPTLWGRAIRWVESYAGFMGQSELLWELYKLGVEQGEPHPDFLDLVDAEGSPVVRVNESAGIFCYWDTSPRMAWQMGVEGERYYASEAQLHSPTEFQRVHRNQWVSPVGSFLQPEWWDACEDKTLPRLPSGSRVPVVLAVDAALTGDCAAVVAVSRDPMHPDTDVAIRDCRIFKPGKKGINLEETIGRTIREWNKKWNVVCVAYDAYQMEKLAQDYKRGLVNISPEEQQGKSQEELETYIAEERKAAKTWYYKFSQQNQRSVADKRLYDMVLARQIHFNPDHTDTDIPTKDGAESLTKHVKQAGSKETGRQIRLEKLSNDAKIDAAVALSMAIDRCMTMNIDNREMDREELINDLRDGKISLDNFNLRMAEIANNMRLRDGG